MSKHVSISPNEAADRLAIHELVEAYAHCFGCYFRTRSFALATWAGQVLRQTQERQGLVFENRDIRAMVKSQMPLRDRVE
jgi:hypothetical protein